MQAIAQAVRHWHWICGAGGEGKGELHCTLSPTERSCLRGGAGLASSLHDKWLARPVVGQRLRKRTAASAIMRPSWPPPSTPTCTRLGSTEPWPFSKYVATMDCRADGSEAACMHWVGLRRFLVSVSAERADAGAAGPVSGPMLDIRCASVRYVKTWAHTCTKQHRRLSPRELRSLACCGSWTDRQWQLCGFGLQCLRP